MTSVQRQGTLDAMSTKRSPRKQPTAQQLAAAVVAAVESRTIDPAEWIALARTELADAQDAVASARARLADAVRYAVGEREWSWTDVAQALGISKQAAHERFGPDGFGAVTAGR